MGGGKENSYIPAALTTVEEIGAAALTPSGDSGAAARRLVEGEWAGGAAGNGLRNDKSGVLTPRRHFWPKHRVPTRARYAPPVFAQKGAAAP